MLGGCDGCDWITPAKLKRLFLLMFDGGVLEDWRLLPIRQRALHGRYSFLVALQGQRLEEAVSIVELAEDLTGWPHEVYLVLTGLHPPHRQHLQ